MVHHPFQGGDLLPRAGGVPDRGLEVQIHNVVGVVGDVGLPVGVQSELGVAALRLEELLQPHQVVVPAELDHLHRHGEAGAAEAGDELGVVDDDDELVGGGLDHLLAEEGAAAALDEVEVGVDLVGAVDGEVDVGVGVEGGEGDAEGGGLLLGALGGGDADDVGEGAGFEEGAELVDDEGGGGAGAEAEDHAAVDVLDGLVGGELLEVVLGEDGGGGLDGEFGAEVDAGGAAEGDRGEEG